MTFHQLKVFVTVAKLRNFTLAAQTLHVRQPSVSILIQGLQRELDVKLFERLGTKVHVTRAGEELVHRAERILAEVEGIKEGMDELKGLKKGKLTVGGSGLAAASFLTIDVEMFRKDYPRVEVILTIQRSEVLEKKLLEGELDLAIMARAPQSSLLLSEVYQEDDVVAVASANHPLTKKRSVALKLIAEQPLITHEKGSHVHEMVEQKFAEKGLRFAARLEIDVHQLGGRSAVINAVANGLGIGFISKSYLVSDVEARRVKVLKVPEFKLKRYMYIVVHKNRQDSSFAQTFIDFLKRYKSNYIDHGV